MKKDIGFWDKNGNYIEDYQEIDNDEYNYKSALEEIREELKFIKENKNE